MRPKQPDTANDDLFRSSLEAILDPDHELIRLAGLIDGRASTMPSERTITTGKGGAGCGSG